MTPAHLQELEAITILHRDWGMTPAAMQVGIGTAARLCAEGV